MASCSERKLSPLANKGRACESCMAHHLGTKSPAADKQGHGQRKGRSCLVWGPVSAFPVPTFPSIFAAHSSSGPQQSTTMSITTGTAGQHRQLESPVYTAFSLQCLTPLLACHRAGPGRCLLEKRAGYQEGGLEARAQPSQLLLGLGAVQQDTSHAQTPLGSQRR